MKSLLFSALLLLPCFIHAKIWEVGPTKIYKLPSEVALLVGNHDTVYIDAGLYTKDVCLWIADNLSIIGVGGKAHLNAEKTAYNKKAIWVIGGNNTYIENIEFSNCEVPDLNGAGIRMEGTNLHIRSCYFHHNQNGILTTDNDQSEVMVEHSEFSHNGAGTGFSHNIYVNRVKLFLFQYNYVHHAYYGHEIKTRAHKNHILYNRITNEDGDASYEIDMPNGGSALVLGNVIQQSKYADNNSIVAYGLEGLTNPAPHNLFFIHNTVINNEDRGTAINVQFKTDTLFCANNIFAGPLNVLVGLPATYINLNNLVNKDINYFNFVSPNSYDYHLSNQSPGIDSALKLQRTFSGLYLDPQAEYAHRMSYKTRYNDLHPDVGAFELQQLTTVEEEGDSDLVAYYNDFAKTFYIRNNNTEQSVTGLMIYDMQGKLLRSIDVQGLSEIDLKNLQPANYYYVLHGRITTGGLFQVTR